MSLHEPILFPRMYWAYVVLAFLDVLLTTLILKAGGVELNVIGRAAFEWAGMLGATLLKVTSMVTVLLICEYAGRAKPDLGRALAFVAVSISVVPVTVGLSVLTDAYALGMWSF